MEIERQVRRRREGRMKKASKTGNKSRESKDEKCSEEEKYEKEKKNKGRRCGKQYDTMEEKKVQIKKSEMKNRRKEKGEEVKIQQAKEEESV